MPQSLPDTTPPKRRFRWPTGMPQLVALLLVLLVDSLVAPHFWQVALQDGRLFGSPIDILNRAAPVALLAIGMTLVIATGGIDLSVGAVMAIAGATTAAMTVAGFSLPIVLLSALGTGILAGLWNGILVAILKIQPFVATLILMVAGRGVAQLITSGQIVTFNSPDLSWFGSGSLLFLPTPVIIAVLTLLLFWLLTRKTALGMFIEAVGINIRAAKNAGVNTRIIVMLTYVLSGLCAAIAGIIVAADIRGADANNAGLWLELDAILAVVIGIFLAHRTRFGNQVYAIGGNTTSANLMGISTRSTTIRIYMLSTGLATLAGIVFSIYTQAGYALAGVGVELDAIASVVIGGTLLSGGVGTVLGTLFGVAIQGLIQTYINFDGTLSSWWTKIAIGILLFIFIALQRGLTVLWENRQSSPVTRVNIAQQ
ncbi:putative sugar ABC transporter membrane protein [Escherichia coli]|nr:sugar ABC transporter permease YjfF [Escherichia coli]STF95958.1 putative sugar ABC transporter membrane protein [Escherichia coli]